MARTPGPRPSAIVLAVVGRLSPNKGQQIAIDALALLPPHLRPHLLLAGDDRVADGNSGFQDQLKATAASLGITDRVHFLGHVEDVALLYQEADLALVPSDDESFCLVAAEAILAVACRSSPAIARPSGRRSVGHTAGLPTVERTPEAFAIAIERHFHNEVAKDMQLAGRRLEEAYGSSRFEKRLLELVGRFLHRTDPHTTPAEAIHHV